MTHALAGALQQAGRIGQRGAVKEPDVYVGVEYINVAEGRISQTGHRTAVMQKLPDFVPALSHRRKPLTRDGSQFAVMFFHPRMDGGILLDRAVKSQQFRSRKSKTPPLQTKGGARLRQAGTRAGPREDAYGSE
jgi:hypothetical protein